MSPFLFAVLIDRLMNEVKQESPWNMMFAYDIVICGKSREQAEASLLKWSRGLEYRRRWIIRVKAEHLCLNGTEGGGSLDSRGSSYLECMSSSIWELRCRKMGSAQVR